MKMVNKTVGMSFEAFHRGTVPIPFVISHHKVQAEKNTIQKRRSSSELKYSMKYFDKDCRNSYLRFLGAIDEMVDKGELKEISSMGAITRLRSLLFDDDLKLVFEALSTVLKCVNQDRKGILSKELVKDDGIDILLNLMHIDIDISNHSKDDQIRIEHFSQMIRGNSIYILGAIISNGLQDQIMDPMMVELILAKTLEADHIERCNALFCFRMAMENDKNIWMDHQVIYNRTIEMLDQEEPVVEEALKLIKVYLKEEIIQQEDIAQESGTFKELSETHYNFSGIAKGILSELKSRDLINIEV